MKLHLLFAFVAFLIFTNKVQSQATAYSNVSATIVITFTAGEITRLNFGEFFPEETESQIIITPEGKRIVSGEVSSKNHSYSSARFYVRGENATSCTIILPDTPTILTNADNTKTMTISDWHADISFGNGIGYRSGMSQEVNLGATLFIGSKEENPTGIYEGTYAINFMYN